MTRGIAGLLGMFSIATIIMTGSRGGFLGLVAVGFVLVWQSKNRQRAIVIGACALLLTLALMGPQYRARHATTIQLGASDYSATSRIAGLRHGFSMLVRRPVLGVGIGCYPIARSAWYGWNLWAHNLYGQLMGELGIIGVIVWTWMIVSIFRNISYVKSSMSTRAPPAGRDLLAYANAVQSLLIMRLVVGMTGHSLFNESWYVFGAVSIQLAALARAEQSSAAEESPSGENTSEEIDKFTGNQSPLAQGYTDGT